jgi:hypothetical protein
MTTPSKRKDPVVISNCVIACATLGTLIVSYLAYTTNVDALRQGYRPYVAAAGIVVSKDDAHKQMQIVQQFRNAGTVPAHEVKADWHVLLNGAPLPNQVYPDKPSELPPQQTNFMHGLIAGDIYTDVTTGRSTLEVDLVVTYKEANGTDHKFHEKSRYIPDVNNFGVMESEGN